MQIIVTCLFGLESLVGEDILALGYEREQIRVIDGQVNLDVPLEQVPRAVAQLNLWVSTGERVLVEVAEFPAATFDELFDHMEKVNWEDYIADGSAFHINGYSRKSALFGISACQSIAKKAIVKRLLQKKGGGDILAEDPQKGLLKIQLAIVSDRVSVRIDTTGDGLHKRGYRPLSNVAPIRETLAAGLVRLSRYIAGRNEALVDPFCGSGTIVIEAARAACGIAPGLQRRFSAEKWFFIGAEIFDEERKKAKEQVRMPISEQIYFYGSDIDPQAVQIAVRNAETAGVGAIVRFKEADALNQDLDTILNWTKLERALIICNPPYGERLLSVEEAETIYRGIGKLYLTNSGTCKKGSRLSVISPDDTFEKVIGFRADKRRKLYNGNIKCQMYHYHKL